MAKPRKNKGKSKRKARGNRRSARPQIAPANSSESPAADSLTVAWMVATFATFVAEACGLLARLAREWIDSARLTTLATTLLAIAFISGLITLALTVAVLRLRKSVPPRAITIAAVVIGVVPLVTVWWLGTR